MEIYQDKDLSGRKLTEGMEEALAAVVRTNGGGVSRYAYSDSVWRGLMRRGLVQGKQGSGWKVVHTREGLEYVRKKGTKTP